MFREILPNLVAPIIVYATLLIPLNILLEAALSFLGVGIRPPTVELGPDDRRRHADLQHRLVVHGLSGRWHCSSRCWRSTCSATGCRDALNPRYATMSAIHIQHRRRRQRCGPVKTLIAALLGAVALAFAAGRLRLELQQLDRPAAAGSAVANGRSRRPRTESLTGGKRGGTLTVLNETEFEHLDPGLAYLQPRLRGRLRDPAAAVLLQAELVGRTDARTWPPDRRRSPPTARPITVHIQQRRQVQPAREPRSDLRRRRLRDRARRQPERRQSLLRKPTSSRSSKACRTSKGGPIPGIETPNSTRSSSTLTEPKAPDRARRAGAAAGARRCPRNTPKSTTR